MGKKTCFQSISEEEREKKKKRAHLVPELFAATSHPALLELTGWLNPNKIRKFCF